MNAKLILECDQYRLVRTEQRLYVEEEKGSAAMGEKRWDGVDVCNTTAPNGNRSEDTIAVPAKLFRAMCDRLDRVPS